MTYLAPSLGWPTLFAAGITRTLSRLPLAFMNPHSENRDKAAEQSKVSPWALVGLVLVLISAIPAICYWHLYFWPSGGNQYGANEYSVFAALLSLVLFSPISAAAGQITICRKCQSRTLRVLGFGFMLPAVVTLLVVALRWCFGYPTLNLW